MLSLIRLSLLPGFIWLLAVNGVLAQVVSVTMSLDKSQISVGESTTLHVFAQIIPAQRASTDRIFSWYVDLLNSSGTVAGLNAPALTKPSSDKNPSTSSQGSQFGANLLGIADTYLNLPGAGRDTPVELFSLPVQAQTAGSATFTVAAGSTLPALSADFLVVPLTGDDPLLGGNYAAATVTLQVGGGPLGPTLSAASTTLPDGSEREVFSFPVTAGKNHFVEASTSIGSDASWQTLPGSPHNTGAATDASALPRRFYRLRIEN